MADAGQPEQGPPHTGPVVRREIEIPVGPLGLTGDLAIPQSPLGVVAFAHGSGSGRFSPRNRHVAEVLQARGIATLLFDLLNPVEELDRRNVFDIPLLASRLTAATSCLKAELEPAQLPIGYFGASTGAAAALWAAAASTDIAAIVSRGGRPDLAAPQLGLVRAPTLLIVGSRDDTVLDHNREAHRLLRCEAEVRIVEGATHLFEEPGTLDAVARLAGDWFVGHFARPT